ncbi:MAG: TonB-dependent receptor [Planctomycetota bacterium]|nr:MAG: TonB-dependent receptor [Planctomycetota bacterium]
MLGASLHVQKEYRFRLRNNGRADRQGFDVHTLGVISQFTTPLKGGDWGDLTYGLEYYRDFVNSFRKDFNADSSLRAVKIQGPIGDESTYDLLGIYLQYEMELLPKRIVVIVGGRYTYAKAKAGKVEDPQTGNRISVSKTFDSIIGQGRILYYWIPEKLNTYFAVAQAFRAPNLSDLTRLDTARTNEIETPSPNLKPEKFLTLEVGTKWMTSSLSLQIAYYYTFINDMIIRFPTGRVIGGNNEVQKANVGDGYVHGIELSGSYIFSKGGPLWKAFPKELGQWEIFGAFGWLEGIADTYPTSAQIEVKEPLSRLLPATAVLGLRWKSLDGRFWMEGVIKMARKQSRLSTRDKNDTQRIPPGGTPGYAIFSLRGGMKLLKNLNITLGVENIGNKDYRVHGSGLNESGTNAFFQIELEY